PRAPAQSGQTRRGSATPPAKHARDLRHRRQSPRPSRTVSHSVGVVTIWRRDARDREILRLALPAFGALAAEPLYVLADTAIVGQLGTRPLAGLAVAGVVLTALFSVFNFLAYSTTAAVARRIGARDRRGAAEIGVD